MMDATYWMWLIFGLVCLGLELMTLAFVFLVLAIAAFATALVAWFSPYFIHQVLVFSVVAIFTGMLLYRYKKLRFFGHQKQSDPMHFDVGQKVTVSQWKSDGTSQVMYRGTLWQVELVDAMKNSAVIRDSRNLTYEITDIKNNKLIVRLI